jgi:hypothetical protein
MEPNELSAQEMVRSKIYIGREQDGSRKHENKKPNIVSNPQIFNGRNGSVHFNILMITGHCKCFSITLKI